MGKKRFTIYLEIEGREIRKNNLKEGSVIRFLRNTLPNLHSNKIERIEIQPCLGTGKYGRSSY